MQLYLIVCKLCKSLKKYVQQYRTMKIMQNHVEIIQKLINVRKVPGIHWESIEQVTPLQHQCNISVEPLNSPVATS